jgi:hypothetical protein
MFPARRFSRQPNSDMTSLIMPPQAGPGLERTEGIEHCDAMTAGLNPLADLVEDIGLMNAIHSSPISH